MADITQRGRFLYSQYVQRRLVPEHDFYAALEACSLICRHERTYTTIQERWCNEEMSDATVDALEKREAKIEARITEVAAQLNTPTGPMRVNFQGDPRGCTVKLWVNGDDPDQRWIGVV